jgi:hypothetical protein
MNVIVLHRPKYSIEAFRANRHAEAQEVTEESDAAVEAFIPAGRVPLEDQVHWIQCPPTTVRPDVIRLRWGCRCFDGKVGPCRPIPSRHVSPV